MDAHRLCWSQLLFLIRLSAQKTPASAYLYYPLAGFFVRSLFTTSAEDRLQPLLTLWAGSGIQARQERLRCSLLLHRKQVREPPTSGRRSDLVETTFSGLGSPPLATPFPEFLPLAASQANYAELMPEYSWNGESREKVATLDSCCTGSRSGSLLLLVILMSGISSDALEELCADKSYDDRIPHVNNILKFAILRKDRSFMAVGGRWNVSIDGGDPSIDNSSLVQTAKRYLKDFTQLDLVNCQNWNQFLEIHYDRVGEDGLFSHKEITIIYLPNLSNCLPALDLWRTQWLEHKRMTAEKEQLAHTRKKKSSETDSTQGDSMPNISEKAVHDAKNVTIKVEDGLERRESEGSPSEMVADVKKVENVKDVIEPKENVTAVSVTGNKELIKKGEIETGKETTSDMASVQDGVSVPATTVKQPAKRRVIKKVVIGKAVNNKAAIEETLPTDAEKKEENNLEGKQGKTEDVIQQDLSPANVKTFVRKKIVKKIPAKAVQNEDKVLETSGVQTQSVAEKETVVKADDNCEQAGNPVKEATPKATGKKKIIKRVIRKKVMKVDKGESADGKHAGGKDPGVATGVENVKAEVRIADIANVAKKTEDKPTNESKEVNVEKQEGGPKTHGEMRKEDEKNAKSDNNPKGGDNMPGDGVESKAAKDQDLKKGDENSKKEKVKDEKKADSKLKSREVSKEKKIETPPKQPGLFLQTKQSKDYKIRSVSLSLDGLLDYTEKDIEESTFEVLSLFAESLSEMLQLEMGRRLLSFLQKLRIKFVTKRNQRKRERDENDVKNEKDASSKKRSKLVDDAKVEDEPTKSVTQDASATNSAAEIDKNDNSTSAFDESKAENKIEGGLEDDYEEPEELSDYDEEMDDAPPDNDAAEELQRETTDTKVESDTKTEKLGTKTEKSAAHEKKEEDTDKKSGNEISKVDGKNDSQKPVDNGTDLGGKADSDKVLVDKELLQAFRYFDRNRVGFIKVEDLRTIIHNLGMFLSHRDVKELVQSALLESNTGRDNRILYSKLVRMSV
ncbi:hypothetical protein Taro_046470 [Colocasia esculenta]|uniref:EF-hand domain-containing protein n=1 Tax=Colocasia esculenta TaxID=4460 RepID=A0A843WZ99_COLES|nr:hypothetical protein [Colocasia esculenta]